MKASAGLQRSRPLGIAIGLVGGGMLAAGPAFAVADEEPLALRLSLELASARPAGAGAGAAGQPGPPAPDLPPLRLALAISRLSPAPGAPTALAMAAPPPAAPSAVSLPVPVPGLPPLPTLPAPPGPGLPPSGIPLPGQPSAPTAAARAPGIPPLAQGLAGPALSPLRPGAPTAPLPTGTSVAPGMPPQPGFPPRSTFPLAPPLPGALPPRGPGPEAPVPFDQVQGLPPRSSLTSSQAPQELPDISGEEWHLAPIRMRGNLGVNLHQFKDDSGGRTQTLTETLNLFTASHIYQPWFAQVNGNLGLVSGTTQRVLPGGLANPGGDTRTTSVSYGGLVHVFPLSRFPFQAYLDHSDNRAVNSGAATQYAATRLGLRQSYRPLVGSENYSLTYDRSVLEADSGSSTVDALQGVFNGSYDEHTVSANSRYSSARGGLNGENSQLFSAGGSHTWRPDEMLTVSTMANLSDQQINYLSSGVLASSNNRLLQANNTFTWIPDEDLPLTVTGGGNLLHMDTSTNFGSNRFSNLGGYAGLNYRFTDRFIGTGNFQLAHTQSGNSQFVVASGTGGLSYTGIPLSFGNFRYSWFTSGSTGFQTISGGASSTRLTGQLGHTLNHNLILNPGNSLGSSLSQSLSLTGDSQAGDTTGLTHSAGLYWRLGYGQRVTGSLSAMLSDTVLTGRYAGHLQSFNLYGNGIANFTRRSSLSASANVSWIKQQQEGLDAQQQLGSQVFNTGQAQWSGGAGISYNHMAPFDIRLLSYTATLQYSSSQVNQRIINGDPNALTWQTTRSFQQRLHYRLGRLSFQLLNTFATVNGKKNASVFLQVTRDFGDL